MRIESWAVTPQSEEILPVRESGHMDLADRLTGALVDGLTAVQIGLVRGLVSQTPQNERPAEDPAEGPAEDHPTRDHQTRDHQTRDHRMNVSASVLRSDAAVHGRCWLVRRSSAVRA